MNLSNAFFSIKILERAQQSWPALSKTAPGALAAAFSKSESANITLADFPPNSKVTLFTFGAHFAMICVPISVEPVNTIFLTRGSCTIVSPTMRPEPVNTWKTFSGIPASKASSANFIAVKGVTSAGFKTTVQPAANAGPNPQPAIGIGKFHGTIIPTTPIGSLKVMSTPPGTGICRPNNLSGPPA